MSDDKSIKVLYGYSELKEKPEFSWKLHDNYARDNLKIIYELGDPQDLGDNVRVLRVQNGVSTVTDVVGYDTTKEHADGFVKIGEEKLGTERPAALALNGFYYIDVGVSVNFSDSFGGENSRNSGILTANECASIMGREINKTEKTNDVLDKFSAEELRTFADMKGKDCR